MSGKVLEVYICMLRATLKFSLSKFLYCVTLLVGHQKWVRLDFTGALGSHPHG